MGSPVQRLSYESYLALERQAAHRHEFVDGVVYAMAGGSIEHGRLAARLAMLLGARLAERPCGVFSSDVRVRIEATNRTTYPDLSVVCGSIERADDDAEALVNPKALVEVLSESTEASDRGEKFAHYRRIPSLQDCVLVSQSERRIEIFHREGQRWTLSEATAGERIRIASLDVELDVDALYQNPLETA